MTDDEFEEWHRRDIEQREAQFAQALEAFKALSDDEKAEFNKSAIQLEEQKLATARRFSEMIPRIIDIPEDVAWIEGHLQGVLEMTAVFDENTEFVKRFAIGARNASLALANLSQLLDEQTTLRPVE